MTDLTRPLRIGMVGSGFMARVHSAAYALLPHTFGAAVPAVELVRIAGGSGVAEAARRYGWKECSDDWAEVVEADDIDVVDVVTPNDAHLEPVLAAARHGKAVICEKPLAETYANARAMTRAVAQAGVPDAACFVYRTWPVVQLARRMVERGDLGAIHGFRGHFEHDTSLDRGGTRSWRTDRRRAGAGALGDIGSHAFDLARHLVGDIATVFAETRTLAPSRSEDDVDDEADVLLRFGNGASGALRLSWLTTGTKMDLGFELHGDRGALSFNWARSNELRFFDRADADDVQGFRSIVLGPQHPGAETLWPIAGMGIGYQEAFVVHLGAFLRGLRDGGTGTPSFAEAERADAAIHAALGSAASGAWTALPVPPPAEDHSSITPTLSQETR